MPQWLYDWNLWWIDFWRDNPIIFYSVLGVILALYLFAQRYAPRRR